MSVDNLIEEMKKVKEDNPTLEIHEVLRIFNIQALRDLTEKIEQVRVKL